MENHQSCLRYIPPHLLVAGWTYQRLIAGKSIPKGVIIISLLLLIFVGLVVIFFLCRREIGDAAWAATMLERIRNCNKMRARLENK